MSARTASELDTLIQDKVPGYRLSRESSKVTNAKPAGSADAGPRPRRRRSVDATTPTINELRSKFLRSDAADAAIDQDEGEDADIVLIEPMEASVGRSRRKAVVLSATGKVLGAQG